MTNTNMKGISALPSRPGTFQVYRKFPSGREIRKQFCGENAEERAIVFREKIYADDFDENSLNKLEDSTLPLFF